MQIEVNLSIARCQDVSIFCRYSCATSNTAQLSCILIAHFKALYQNTFENLSALHASKIFFLVISVIAY